MFLIIDHLSVKARLKLTVWSWKTVQFNVKIISEDGLEGCTQKKGATSPEDPIEVEGIFHVEVSQLDRAILFQGSVHVPELTIDQSKRRSID